MYRLTEEVKNNLVEEVKKYSKDEFQLFCDEYGWADWMNEFTEAKDGEPISELECKEIDKILKEAFNSVHFQ